MNSYLLPTHHLFTCIIGLNFIKAILDLNYGIFDLNVFLLSTRLYSAVLWGVRKKLSNKLPSVFPP